MPRHGQHRFVTTYTALISASIAALIGAGCNEYDVSNLRGHDVFWQNESNVVADLLFVIDNSASMKEEQELLGTSFSAFVEAIEDTISDLQIGVTTTDVDSDEAGQLTAPLMAANDPDLSALFLEAATVGTDGSRIEKGFEAALLATASETNPDLLRDGAILHVIFVSDEDDQSTVSVDGLKTALEGRVGQNKLLVHAIVGDLPGGCASGSSAADAGERYAELTEETLGQRDSICNDSHKEILGRIGLDAAGLTDTFDLTDLPIADTIEVWVDDVKMFERDLDGWQYDVGENAVNFAGRAVPRPGMEIVIDYELWAGVEGTTDGESSVAP
jgi:hypothetical protein